MHSKRIKHSSILTRVEDVGIALDATFTYKVRQQRR